MNAGVMLKANKAKAISVAERSNASVSSRSISGIAGSNPAKTWIFLYCVCCVLRR